MDMFLLSGDKRSTSALAISKSLGVACFTAWSMCHKIRHAMGARDATHKMNGIVEMDEAFFGTADEGGKGTKKTAVMVPVSLTCGKPLFASIKVVGAVNWPTALSFAENTVTKGSEVRTNGLNIYPTLSRNGYNLVQKGYSPKKRPGHLLGGIFSRLVMACAFLGKITYHELYSGALRFTKPHESGVNRRYFYKPECCKFHRSRV